MSVYVDPAIWSYRGMTMCHMLADTPAELHAMADAIGIDRRHYQFPKSTTPHYDICKTKRALAVKLGAVEVDLRGIAAVRAVVLADVRISPDKWKAV